jgi:predicted nucleic-acid-binding protein
VIGLDANILLRLWLDDDPAQNRRIDALLTEHGRAPASLLVTDVVLAEAIWTLQSAYGRDKAAQLLALRSLLDETAFAFDDRESIERAVAMFEHASCGFSDGLIASRHASQGCDFTATLDRRMRRLPGVRVI